MSWAVSLLRLELWVFTRAAGPCVCRCVAQTTTSSPVHLHGIANDACQPDNRLCFRVGDSGFLKDVLKSHAPPSWARADQAANPWPIHGGSR